VLRAHGKVVPDDLGLVTFDNDYAAQSSTPPLTTVEQPTVEQGRRMVDVLLQLIDGGSVPQVTMMPTRIIERGSEGAAWCDAWRSPPAASPTATGARS